MLRFTLALAAVASASLILLLLFIALSTSGVHSLPQGFTTFFDAEKCPQGWQALESSQGRMIVSVADANNAGITVGVPLTDREDRTHSHRTKLTGNLQYQHIAGADGSNTEAAAHGAVSTTLTSDDATSGLPFTQLILCRITPEAADDTPTAIGTIGFFDPSVNSCPSINTTKTSLKNKNKNKNKKQTKAGTSWTPMNALNGRLAVGGFVEGGAIANNQPSYSSGEDRKHNHTGNTVHVQETHVDFVGIDGCCNDGPSKYTTDLTIAGDSDSASSNLPYLQLLTCGSTDFTFNLTMPDGALVFNQEKCPPGWELALELAGRVLVSLPRGGQPGGFFGGQSFTPSKPVDPLHKHGLNSTISFPPVGIELGSGCCGGPYAGSGSFPVQGTTTDNDVDVPFTMYPLCRQSSDHKKKNKNNNHNNRVVGRRFVEFQEKMMVEKMMGKNIKH